MPGAEGGIGAGGVGEGAAEYVKFPAVALRPPLKVTVTGTVPDPAGTVTVQVSPDPAVRLVAGALPNATEATVESSTL
jgi:hypothetical protein